MSDLRTSTWSIAAADGSGAFDAHVAWPEGPGPHPAVVIVQEIFGVNANIRAVAQTYAQAGFVAVALDLFWRLQAGVDLGYSEAERGQAFALMQRFDAEAGVADIQSTIDRVRHDAACTGRVGVVGFCLGGKMAYLSACATDADASVGYYAVGLERLLDRAEHIQRPLVLHIAEQDALCPPEAREAILAALADQPQVTCHVYPDVGHAFARVNGDHWAPQAAELANARTLALLRSL
jgi:carboxymethylenebutenolidase